MNEQIKDMQKALQSTTDELTNSTKERDELIDENNNLHQELGFAKDTLDTKERELETKIGFD